MWIFEPIRKILNNFKLNLFQYNYIRVNFYLHVKFLNLQMYFMRDWNIFTFKLIEVNRI